MERRAVRSKVNPGEKIFLRPASLEEAWRAFEAADGDAVYLAGGTDVMVNYKKKRIRPRVFISLNGLTGYDRVSLASEEILLGGLTTLETLAADPLVAAHLPGLRDAAGNMASPQIRAVATLGGNLANAAPSADTAPPLLSHGAAVVLASPGGLRRVPLDEFFLAPGRAAMSPGEIIVSVAAPLPRPPCGGGYVKVSRRKAMDLALLGVAVHLEFQTDRGTCQLARVALGVAGPVPARAREAEDYLTGRGINAESLAEAGRLAAAESSCRDSLRGEAWYRREMIRVHVRRLGLRALEMAQAV